jgi:hypothetical protein
MKNVLFEQKKISSYKRRVLENETEIMQQYLKMQQISLLHKYTVLVSGGVSTCTLTSGGRSFNP